MLVCLYPGDVCKRVPACMLIRRCMAAMSEFQTCTHACIQVSLPASMFVCIHAFNRATMCVHACVCTVSMFVRACIYAHVHVYFHVYVSKHLSHVMLLRCPPQALRLNRATLADWIWRRCVYNHVRVQLHVCPCDTRIHILKHVCAHVYVFGHVHRHAHAVATVVACLYARMCLYVHVHM